MIETATEEPTKDRFYLNVLLFYCIGFMMDMQDLFLLNIEIFWNDKFEENGIVHEKARNALDDIHKLQSIFSVLDTVLPIALLIFDQIFLRQVKLTNKLLTSFISFNILFSMTVVFSAIDTYPWKEMYYYSMLVLYIMALLAKNILFGMTIIMSTGYPVVYLTALTTGRAATGVLSSSLQIFLLLINASPKTCGLILFSVGFVCVFIVLVLYFVILKYSVIFHYRLEALAERVRTFEMPKMSFIWALFKQQKSLILSALLVGGATEVLQPDFTSTIHSKDFGEGYKWNDTYFVPVLTIWLYNVCDFCGKVAAIKIAHLINTKTLLLLSIFRFVLVPLLLIINVTKKNHIGLVFRSDIFHAIFQIVLGLTNGLGLNISIARASRKYQTLGHANGFSAFFMLMGGILMSDSFTRLRSVIIKLIK